MPLVNYNEEIFNQILDKFSRQTDSQLRDIQKQNCPRYINLELEEIENRQYRYMEKTYIATNRLFKVNNSAEILNRKISAKYNGLIKPLIDSENLKAFLLYINDRFIEWSRVKFIADDRNIYLEITGLDKLDVIFGDTLSPTTITTASFQINIPIIDSEFQNDLTIEIECVDASKIGNITFCTMPTTLASKTSTKATFTVSKAKILNSYNKNKHNWIEVGTSIGSSSDLKIKTVRVFSNVVQNIAINKIDTLLINQKVDYTESALFSTFLSTDKFFFMNGSNVVRNTNVFPAFCTRINFSFPYYLLLKNSNVTQFNITTLPYLNKLFKENIICSSGYTGINTCNLTEKRLNIFESDMPFNDGGGSYQKIFYWYDDKTFDIFARMQSKFDLVTAIKNNQALPTFLAGKESFDFVYDKDLSYVENRENFARYIAEYDSSVFNDYISNRGFVNSRAYSGAQIKSIGTVSGTNTILKASRRMDGVLNTGVIVFKNNLLYDLTKVKLVNNQVTVTFVTAELLDTDNIELLYVKNIDNSFIHTNIYDINDTFTTKIPKDNIELYSINRINSLYPYNPSNSYMYKIDAVLTEVAPYTYTVQMDNSYYNTDIIITSRAKFVSDKIVASPLEEGGMTRIILNDNFKCCDDPLHYLVFHNGRMINQDDLKIILNSPDLPIVERSIYLNKKLSFNDEVSVYYLPKRIIQTNFAGIIRSDGVISATMSLYPEGLKNEYLFANGKRIHKNNIEYISSNLGKMKINLNTTINVVTLGEYGFIDDVLNMIKDVIDMWDQAAKLMTNAEISALTGFDISYTNTEIDNRSGNYTAAMVAYELLRRYYILTNQSMVLDASVYFNYALDPIICMSENGTSNKVILMDSSMTQINTLTNS